MAPAPQPASDRPVLSVERLRAYYQMKYFGIDREVRAVDDITLHIDRNEIYGLAGDRAPGRPRSSRRSRQRTVLRSTSSAVR